MNEETKFNVRDGWSNWIYRQAKVINGLLYLSNKRNNYLGWVEESHRDKILGLAENLRDKFLSSYRGSHLAEKRGSKYTLQMSIDCKGYVSVSRTPNFPSMKRSLP